MRAGLAFLPLFAATFFLSWGAGRMTARWGPARPMVIGLVIGLVGLLLLLPADAGISYWALVPGLLLVSAGALIPAPLSVAVIAAAPPEQSGVVSGVLNAMRQTGGALGVAILGSLIAANAFVDGMRWALVISAAPTAWRSRSRYATGTSRARSASRYLPASWISAPVRTLPPTRRASVSRAGQHVAPGAPQLGGSAPLAPRRSGVAAITSSPRA